MKTVFHKQQRNTVKYFDGGLRVKMGVSGHSLTVLNSRKLRNLFSFFFLFLFFFLGGGDMAQ